MSEKISIEGDAALLEKRKVKRPSRFKVILHNDDYTPMDFVVYLIMSVFHKTEDEAAQLMLTVHVKGKAICGIYPKEIAENKVDKAMSMAKQEGHPLLCTMQKE
ncbi:ATP-dependent Clp protease adaptor protein ClpS [Lentisphaera araneosa HTCC2155]|jgi:ATP-dependent Clp protease adaptor protein ClpS|uniref:ATP-dependent Clp protease adapter protein ClpS n=1 Tax=Lentisphaera araneosa HTCC2155 TaxID=313628 RepID=A6DNS4_9BACT|nr:ATP-dependent Clp protease adapter ClpS [Lentisphaera araneosa]EDM26733.1 ATP-dependent Clp protease adaptor protein ClpS [Lentisphaera araneosa HTCC2155]